MSRNTKIVRHERRTYIKGKIQGKYIGYVNLAASKTSEYDIYDIEIVSGEIFISEFHGDIQKHDEVDKAWKKQLDDHPVYNAKIPDNIPVKFANINGENRTYTLALNDKKLQNVNLSRQVYDGDKVYGDISAEISGFVTHFDEEKINIIPPPEPPFKTKERTGKFEKKDCLIRYEYYYSDRTTYWGAWERITTGECAGPGCWEVLRDLISILLLVFFIIPIVVYGWRILLPIALIAGIIYLMSSLGSIVFNAFRWFFYLASLALLFALGIGLLNLIMEIIESPRIDPPLAQDEEEEVTQIQYDPIIQDSLIVHHRIWQDYEGNEYEMDIKVRKSNYLSAQSYRDNLSFQATTDIAYNQMVNQLSKHDAGNLDLVYQSLDSLKQKHGLTSAKFAEVVVSMIQDIPYTLILAEDCNPYSYSDAWLRDYLQSGEACKGDVKYGILSPIEFLGSLDGDCDTRTLLLYTILSHYGYDVVMLKSEIYMHSILGVNLPSSGQTKVINGKPYLLWETTAKNLPPGFIDQNMSNLAYWEIALIH